MNREIKFRVWDNFHKTTPAKFWRSEEVGMVEFWRWISQHTNTTENIQQFTGLKDKNGQDIYEGDIVKFYSLGFELIGEVIYLDARFVIKANNQVLNFRDVAGFMGEYQIIGNVHENSELLAK